MAVVKGIAYWASIQQPNTTFEPQWCIDVIVEKDVAKGLMGKGLNVKVITDDSYGAENKGKGVLKVKQKVSGKNGDFPAPRVVDAGKNPITCLVGNGSGVEVAFDIRQWEWGGKAGVAADLKAVRVLELVEFTGGGDSGVDDFEDIEGAEKAPDDFDNEETPWDE